LNHYKKYSAAGMDFAQPLSAQTQHASKIYTSSTGNISVSVLCRIDYSINQNSDNLLWPLISFKTALI